MGTLHNVAKFHTNQSITSPLKMHFVNIKYIKIRRHFDQFCGSSELSTKMELLGF